MNLPKDIYFIFGGHFLTNKKKNETNYSFLFLQMVLKLQELALRLVPTQDVIEHNITHLLGHQNRFLQDFSIHPVKPIDEYFFSALLDTGNTSLFWMMKFVNKQIHHLPFNTAVLACWQEYYMARRSLMAFAMRTHWDKVLMLVYTIDYGEKNRMTNNIFHQKRSYRWTQEDWEFVSTLHLEQLFYISSNYVY